MRPFQIYFHIIPKLIMDSSYKFFNQSKVMYRICAEIYQKYVSSGLNKMTEEVLLSIKENILEQRPGYEAYTDEIMNSMQLDHVLESEMYYMMSSFEEESTEQMDAGMRYQQRYLELAVDHIVILFAKFYDFYRVIGTYSYIKNPKKG